MSTRFGRIASLAQRNLLDKWYRLDENNVPAHHYLAAVPAERPDWARIEHELRSSIEQGAVKCDLSEECRVRYTASATEQEVYAGILRWASPCGAACFFREIENAKAALDATRALREPWASFWDLEEGLSVNKDAQARQNQLIEQVKDRLGTRIHHYR
jgi:hypothetical protein